MSEQKATDAPPVAPRIYDRVIVWAFILLLFVPVTFRGVVRQRAIPGTPRLLADVQNISCLFSYKPKWWNTFHLQARFSEGGPWVDLDESELFPMRPFGRRTRMHRYLVAWRGARGPKMEELARFVFRRYEALHPSDLQPVAVRFGRSLTRPDPEQPPESGFQRARWVDVPKSRKNVIVAYTRAILEGS